MNKNQKISLLVLRLAMGWFFFHAGIVKVLNSGWSAEGFIKGAKLFPGFFNMLLQPGVLPIVNLVNEWGLTLLGVSLLAGAFVRLSAPLGALLMLLYYIPRGLPKPDPNSFIVDSHIIYILVLIYFAVVGAGKYWGFDGWLFGRKQNRADESMPSQEEVASVPESNLPDLR